MGHVRVGKGNLRRAAAIAVCAGVTGCQSDFGGNAARQAPIAGPEFVVEFKKIDTTGRGRITLEEATSYYNRRFTELDKNRDGLLDVQELESFMPVMNISSVRELLLALDRNSDNKLSRSEFLIIVNKLFQMATIPSQLTLGDLKRKTSNEDE